jgi:hypothetical protein
MMKQGTCNTGNVSLSKTLEQALAMLQHEATGT